MDSIVLQAVAIEDKPVICRLMQLYLGEFSQFSGEDVDAHGLFSYRYLDLYWTEPDRFPYLIRTNGRTAGFALVRRLEEGSDPRYQLAEFFVLPKYRRQGIGRYVAITLFDCFSGHWEVQQEAANKPAQAFWREVINGYTKSYYRETWREGVDHVGPVQHFRSGR